MRPPGPRLSPFDTLLATACAGLLLVGVIGFPLASLRLSPRGALGSVLAVGGLAALLAYYSRRDEPRIRDTLKLTLWGVVLSTLYLLPMYVASRRAMPFRDDYLAWADARLGFSLPTILAWTAEHPTVKAVLDAAYGSLQVGCLIALMVPPLAGASQRTKELLVALVLSVAATLVVYVFFQAIGPWVAFPLHPTPMQRACGRACRLLRSGAPYLVDLSRPDPLIAFPSWHVILAVLSAVTLARVGWLWAVAIPWGALVVVSTVTTGWHYVVDSVAGVAIGAIGYGVALGFTCWERRWSVRR